MKKRIAMLAIAGTSIGMFAAVPTASAAHCVENGEPGFSYFGQEGREKGAPRGASSCNDDPNPSADMSTNPSTRAPGRN